MNLQPLHTADSPILDCHDQRQELFRELDSKARAFEAEYDRLNYRDDQFDLSDAALSVALGVLATASLANRRWLLVLAWAFGAVGIVMGLAGFFRLNLHPDWLVKILS